MYLKKIFFLFQVLILNCYYFKSQTVNFTEQQILNKYNDVLSNNINEIKQLYNYSKDKDYKKGMLKGLLGMQKYYLAEENYNISSKCSVMAEKLALLLKNNEALSSIYLYRAQVATLLDLHRQAKSNLNRSVFYSEKIDDEFEKRIQLSTVYANFAGIYESDTNIHANDSISYYLQKSLQVLEDITIHNLNNLQKAKYYDLLITGNMNMGSFYTCIPQLPRLGVAESYFKKTLGFSKTVPQYFQKWDLDVYKSLGIFYKKKGNVNESVSFFNKALEIEKRKRNPGIRLIIYKELASTHYSLRNNIVKQDNYLKLYSKLNDSIKAAGKLSLIQNPKDQIKKTTKVLPKNYGENSKIILVISSVSIVIGLMIMWVLFYKKSKMTKTKYLLLVEKLKNNIAKPEYNEEKFYIENKENENITSKINISSGTKKKILKRLLAFEASESFLKKDINLTSMSHQKNTNPKYLSEIIRIHKHRNFNGYINSLRINYIVQKLYNDPKYREYKISYLAEECGYISSQVFVIAFKKETGVTPSYFIDQLKTETESDYILI